MSPDLSASDPASRRHSTATAGSSPDSHLATSIRARGAGTDRADLRPSGTARRGGRRDCASPSGPRPIARWPAGASPLPAREQREPASARWIRSSYDLSAVVDFYESTRWLTRLVSVMGAARDLGGPRPARRIGTDPADLPSVGATPRRGLRRRGETRQRTLPRQGQPRLLHTRRCPLSAPPAPNVSCLSTAPPQTGQTVPVRSPCFG